MDCEVDNGSVQEDEGLGWGKSLPVPRVQEMVRNDSESVPERYIQEHNRSPLDSEFSPYHFEIPIINFSALANGDEDEQRKLDIACKDGGFFQVNILHVQPMQQCFIVVRSLYSLEAVLPRAKGFDAFCT
ncbi:hypothetical protein ACOSQ4_032835 [Xanthoceras sorbifolium]